jgi:hypothetical protein
MNKAAGLECPLPDALNRCSSENGRQLPAQIKTEDQKNASMSLASLCAFIEPGDQGSSCSIGFGPARPSLLSIIVLR